MSYDLIGVGFGPASLAVAVALVENWDAAKAAGTKPPVTRVCFVEKHDRFAWHPGMLLPGTKMQVSFLKDLATLRNPASPFTFLAYLHEHSRLVSFINRGLSAPTRREYADYLTWASRKVQEHEGIEVFFGQEVLSIDGDASGDKVTVVSRSMTTGEEIVRTASNLLISPGGVANIPPQIVPIFPHPQIVHTSQYAPSIPKILDLLRAPDSSHQIPLRVAVIGGGQSSAEVYLDLASRLASIPTPAGQHHQLDLIFRKGSLKPADDSPFANEIFNPESTDFMFNLPQSARAAVKNEYHNTNYSVVSPDTLQTVYEVVYDQKVESHLGHRDPALTTDDDSSKPRFNLLPYHTILNASVTSSFSSGNDQFTLGLHHTLYEKFEEAVYDVIILGTGYDRQCSARLLSQSKTIAAAFGLGPESETENAKSSDDEADSSGPATPSSPVSMSSMKLTDPNPPRLTLSRNYRLVHSDTSNVDKPVFKFKPPIYVQGSSELSHGLSDTLLSVASVRSGEIVGDLMMAAAQ